MYIYIHHINRDIDTSVSVIKLYIYIYIHSTKPSSILMISCIKFPFLGGGCLFSLRLSDMDLEARKQLLN